MSESKRARMTEKDTRDLRVGEALNDFLDRKARGEAVSEDELLARHPDLADELREHLELLRGLEPPRVTIDELINKGVLTRSSDPRYMAELGAYKITSFLGRGGMGVVLKAYEESLDRTVALKLLRPELTQDKTALHRFEREAKAAAALQHPNIVTVYAVGEERGTHFFAMEYVEGPTLADVIREQAPLPCEMIRHVFQQVLAGLAAAHDTGLIHRDIKPSNILLHGFSPPCQEGNGKAPVSPPCQGGVGGGLSPLEQGGTSNAIRDPSVSEGSTITVKIADFGLARIVSSQTRMTMPDSLLGTPEYMSPEQARGDDDIDHRTDLYSAGVVLYEMLTGRTPFKADTPSAVIHQILHERPGDPRMIAKSVDPQLASLALRLLAKQPRDRFESAATAMAALEAGQRVAFPERLRQWIRWSAFCLVAITLLSVAVFWVIRGASHVDRPGASTPESEPRFLDVRVETNGEKPTTNVQVKYVGSPTWTDFLDLGDDAKRVSGAELLDMDGDARLDVVLGVLQPIDGYCLFAYDIERNRIWRKELYSDSRHSSIPWPKPIPPAYWKCHDLLKENVDHEPNPELVVAAMDADYYPARVSIVEPETGNVDPTFWHPGHIHQLRIEADFFATGCPAIMAWGCNNMLSAPTDRSSASRAHSAKYSLVPCIMILDPRGMNGMGPSYIGQIQRLPAPVYAYAFLDLPFSCLAKYVPDGGTERVYATLDETARVTAVRPEPSHVPDDTAPWFRLRVSMADGKAGVFLTVDRHLRFRKVVGGLYAPYDNEDFWKRRWCPIIQNGDYIAIPPDAQSGEHDE